ncbi:MAG TPA: hypothetical protein VL947_02895 [Cytophagales bacterium]|nr:hypothetical protein [Cytophagales bacterium]
MIKKLHYLSAIILVGFTMGHLLNHLMILHSEQAHLSFMEAFRKIYRFPPLEVLLYVSCIIQTVTGILLLRKIWHLKNDIWHLLRVYSGIYLMFFITVHPLAILVGRYVWHMDTNLYFGAATFNIAPIMYFFMVYYTVAVVSFFTHLACVHRTKMAAHSSLKAATRQAVALIMVAVVIVFLIIYNMVGIKIPHEYFRKYELYIKSSNVSFILDFRRVDRGYIFF